MWEPFSRPGCSRQVSCWNPSPGLGAEGMFHIGTLLQAWVEKAGFMLEPFYRPGCSSHVSCWNPFTGLGGEGRFHVGTLLQAWVH